jgi:hypothetical protein
VKPPNYESLPHFDTQPFCSTATPNDRAAYNSTLVMNMNFVPASSNGGTNGTDTSSAESFVMSFLYAFGGIAGAAALLN